MPLLEAMMLAGNKNNVQSEFSLVKYTGTGASNTITGVGFWPHLIIIKSVDYSDVWGVFTNLNSIHRYHTLESNSTFVTSDTTTLTARSGDGFTVGTSTKFNTSGKEYIALCWNTPTFISGYEMYGSGCSVIKYAANNTAGRELAHSLGVIPDWHWIKNRDSNIDWSCYTKENGADYKLEINNTDSRSTTANYDNTEPTDSVITLGNGSGVNDGSDDYMAYLFASQDGWCDIGEYIGNGSSTGPLIDCGFAPDALMIKSNNSNRWMFYDTVRDTGSNPLDEVLYPSETNAYGTGANEIDFLGNGFQPASGDSRTNDNGIVYQYMALKAR